MSVTGSYNKKVLDRYLNFRFCTRSRFGCYFVFPSYLFNTMLHVDQTISELSNSFLHQNLFRHPAQ